MLLGEVTDASTEKAPFDIQVLQPVLPESLEACGMNGGTPLTVRGVRLFFHVSLTQLCMAALKLWAEPKASSYSFDFPFV